MPLGNATLMYLAGVSGMFMKKSQLAASVSRSGVW
jgi:hypothetical protein